MELCGGQRGGKMGVVNLSIVSGLCCMALFPLLFYISRYARSLIGNTINSSV